MTQKLAELSISYIQSFSFEDMGYTLWMTVGTPLVQKKICFKGIININISRDILDLEPDDISVFEVNHEFRKPTIDDFKDYQFLADKDLNFPKLHLVTFHASMIITILCKEVEVGHQ